MPSTMESECTGTFCKPWPRDKALCMEQVTQPDPRVLALLEELARGPMPDWDPPPALLVLNKVRTFLHC